MWMKSSRTRRLATVGVVLALTACGGPTANPEGSEGKLTIAGSIPTGLDPGQENTSLGAIAIMGLIEGRLTTIDPDGTTVSMGLAETVEPVGRKGWEVTLKPGLEFSDGSALTASDVVASFEYHMDDKLNYGGDEFSVIERVTSAGDLTINFDLKRPKPTLPFVLANAYASIIPSEAIEEKGKDLYKDEHPPTAGQFQVESFDENHISLVANPHYAGEQPSTKTLVFKNVADPTTRLAQLQGGGEIDVAMSLAPHQVAELSGPIEGHTVPSVNGLTALVMNNRHNSVLSDVRIRKAIAMAIDRDQVNQIAYAGLNEPQYSLWASGSRYNEPIPYLSPEADLEGAREMLAGTECANGCTLRLIVGSGTPELVDTATVVQENLKSIGIEVNVEKYEYAAVAEDALNGNYDLMPNYTYSTADIPDASLAWLFGPVVEAWRSGYSSPEMERLIKDVSVASGPAREAAMDQVNALFEKDLPFAPVASVPHVWASRVPTDTFDMDSTFSFRVG